MKTRTTKLPAPIVTAMRSRIARDLRAMRSVGMARHSLRGERLRTFAYGWLCCGIDFASEHGNAAAQVYYQAMRAARYTPPRDGTLGPNLPRT